MVPTQEHGNDQQYAVMAPTLPRGNLLGDALASSRHPSARRRGLSAAVCATPAGYGHQRMPPVADLWPGAWLMAVVIAAQRVMDRAPDQAAIVVDNYSHLRFTSPRRLKVCSYAFAMPSPIAKSAKRMRMARAR